MNAPPPEALSSAADLANGAWEAMAAVGRHLSVSAANNGTKPWDITGRLAVKISGPSRVLLARGAC